ncbi:MAG: hypothetical protein ACREXK_09960 [Gammaproteobacteria bacterium]
MDAASGARTLISNFGNAAQGPLGLDPSDLALEATGTLLVIDFSAGTGSAGALFRVDAATGNRTLISNFGNALQGVLGVDPFALAYEAGGTVLVIDFNAGTDFRGALFRVDPASGFRGLVSDFANANQGPLGRTPFGLTLEAAGTVPVIDDSAGTGGRGALFRVNRLNGPRTLVSDFGNTGQGALGAHPSSVAVIVPTAASRPCSATTAITSSWTPRTTM